MRNSGGSLRAVRSASSSRVESRTSTPPPIEMASAWVRQLEIAGLLRFTESMTTDSLPMRYTVIMLNGDSVDGQNGRSDAQAGACWSLDVGGQN
ncbi:hypothetical protein, partial [Burkholderia ubonensis]|uniref:hypothetical protein n=1 Tax=Burkholderia ubonensis TaxID=101571 RepID=UPI001E2EBD7A